MVLKVIVPALPHVAAKVILEVLLIMEVNSKMQMTKIRGFEKGFIATHLINIGGKVGIFQNLYQNEEGLSVSELAKNLIFMNLI